MKTLVICCDGTWNTADQDNAPTNVTKMARAIHQRSDDGEPQIVYYDEGVGTGNFFDRFLGGALGLGLSANVQQAYRFLALNYESGDRIMLFGFSRGAYTVRSLAGLVGLVGLLRKGSLEQLPYIWDHYRTPPAERGAKPIDPAWIEFKPDIHVLGVWDTVGSLGIPGNWLRWVGRRRYAFHDVNLSPRIRHAYQALAIDEWRKAFLPAVWNSDNAGTDQVVEQVWFSGAHSNVGGGYRDAILSDAAFLWMCGKVGPLLKLDEDYLHRKVQVLQAEEAKGEQVDARRGIWKLMPRALREIGKDRTETVHESALWRYRTKIYENFRPAPYKPTNLEAWLEQTEQGA